MKQNQQNPRTKRLLILVALSAAAGVSAVSTGTRSSVAAAAEYSVQQAQVDSLPSPAGPGSAEPNFTVDQNGRVFLSWLEPSDGGHALRLSIWENSRWSAPRTIVARRDFFVNWADFPSTVALDGGQLAAHWLQRTGTGTYAYGVRVALSSNSGQTWSNPITPHRDSSQTEHGFVSMWREQGKLGLVWLDGRSLNTPGKPNEMTLMATTISPDGTPGTESLLDARTCECCQTAAAVTAQGPVVAYRDRSVQEIRDIYVTRRVNGTWTQGVPVHADNWHINACPVNGPSIAANGNRVALAWFTGANDSARVKVAFSDNAGARFGAPIRLDGGDPVGRVDVKLLPDGAALVTWIERAGGDTAAVRVRRISRDGRAGPAVTVAASSVARASGFPRMALTSDQVFFAWTQPARPSVVRVARVALSAFR